MCPLLLVNLSKKVYRISCCGRSKDIGGLQEKTVNMNILIQNKKVQKDILSYVMICQVRILVLSAIYLRHNTQDYEFILVRGRLRGEDT